MSSLINFNPNGVVNFSPYGSLVIAGTTASASATFTTTASANASSVMVYNSGTTTAYLAFGKTSATAVVAGSTETQNAYFVAPGAIVVFTKGNNNDTVAVIYGSGSGNVLISAGEGA